MFFVHFFLYAAGFDSLVLLASCGDIVCVWYTYREVLSFITYMVHFCVALQNPHPKKSGRFSIHPEISYRYVRPSVRTGHLVHVSSSYAIRNIYIVHVSQPHIVRSILYRDPTRLGCALLKYSYIASLPSFSRVLSETNQRNIHSRVPVPHESTVCL